MKAAAVLVQDTAYRPCEDEPFMNERQTEYFRQKLLQWKAKRSLEEIIASAWNWAQKTPA